MSLSNADGLRYHKEPGKPVTYRQSATKSGPFPARLWHCQEFDCLEGQGRFLAQQLHTKRRIGEVYPGK